LLIFVLPIEQSHADLWQDLWTTKDQQAAQALKQGDAKTAAELFEDPQWRAAAQHRAGDFDVAAKGFDQQTPASLYNKATALARAGKIPDAIKTYDEALKLNPDMDDAKFNKELLESLPPPPKNEQQNDSDQQNDDQENSDDESDQQDESQQQNEDSEQNQDSQSNNDNSESDSEQENSDSEQDNSNDSNSESEQEDNSESEPAEENQNDEQAEDPAEQQQSDPQKTPEQETETVNANSAEADLSDEEKNAIEQQLRLLQDNPGELLKRKFKYQYEQNGGTGNSGEQRW
jgi:Ca-activated chloride channel family protein